MRFYRNSAMDDEECPRCKTTKYQNPSLVVMINSCGHSLCKECVELLFIKGSGNCVECGVPLRRSDFRVKLFDDNFVEKEVEIRKRLIKEYFKSEDDFDTLVEYNNYLEEFENIIYNLTHNTNVAETTDKIEKYRKENKEAILKNKMKYYKVLAILDEQVEEEKQNEEYKKNEIFEEEQSQKKRKILEKEALIDELSYSEKNAKNILDLYTESKADYKEKDSLKKFPKTSHFSSGQSISGNTSVYRQIPKFELGPLYVYKEPELILDGPAYPTYDEISSRGYLRFLREQTTVETTAGFSMQTACMRILQEGMLGLYYSPSSLKSNNTNKVLL